MELRQRVRASPLYFGKKSPDDPDALSFWYGTALPACLPSLPAWRSAAATIRYVND